MDTKVLFTGGSGLLGSEMKKIAPEFVYPSSAEFNIIDYKGMELYLKSGAFNLVIHAAAIASPPGVEKDPAQGLEVNIIGTANVARLCLKYGLRLVYLSTDYVFDGERGGYCETDPVLPGGKYAWSKLGGECAVRLVDDSLVIRTTFGPKEFPYEKAFTDQWTSRQAADIIAPKVLKAALSQARGIIHIGGKRQTVYEYATGLPSSKAKRIGKLARKDVAFPTPKDTSLNTELYEKLF